MSQFPNNFTFKVLDGQCLYNNEKLYKCDGNVQFNINNSKSNNQQYLSASSYCEFDDKECINTNIEDLHSKKIISDKDYEDWNKSYENWKQKDFASGNRYDD